MRKQFSNQEILEYATVLNQIFLSEDKEIVLPIKVNFYLQKNINTLTQAAAEIEESRMQIGEKYGEYSIEDQAYFIKDPEQRQLAQNDLKKLLSIDQVLEIYYVSFDDLKDTQLTTAEMNAMMFMINEE